MSIPGRTRNRPADGLAYRAQISHQLIENRIGQSLERVYRRLLGNRVHVQNDAVGSHGYGGFGDGWHIRPLKCCVAGVDDYRQVSVLPDRWYHLNVHDEPRCGFVGVGSRDAPLAQNNVGVTLMQDVFGSSQPIPQATAKVALEQDRLEQERPRVD